MPRLQPSLLRRAHRASPLLAALLPACRDLGSARNELRWIREHVLAKNGDPGSPPQRSSRTTIARLCAARARGLPLQYVLGSQPFGPLDIACRAGVLIPRPETEAWVYALAELLRSSSNSSSSFRGNGNSSGTGVGGGLRDAPPAPLRVVDFCSGTGCVALLLAALLLARPQTGPRRRGARIRGFDVEPRAVALARRNLARNADRLGPRGGLGGSGTGTPGVVAFERADVFAEDWLDFLRRDAREDGHAEPSIDVLVSNPPYISARGFDRDTGRSVRNHEPRLALVPDPALIIGRTNSESYDCAPEDVFYARLLRIAERTRTGVVVFEVGDLAQAARVVAMALAVGTAKTAPEGGSGGWDATSVEIWRDWPDMQPEEHEAQTARVAGFEIPVRGSGHGRVVVLRRGVWYTSRGRG